MTGATPGRWTHTGYTQQLVFGAGVITELSGLVRTLGLRRILLVATRGRAESDEGARVVKALGRSLASTFAEVTSHVPVPSVQAAMQQARRDGIDGVVSFGGGSCADLAKAICFFTEQEQGTPGASFADRPALPHISIPTTYSGAELTPFFGMTDPATHQKSGSGGPTIAPVAAIYDPELTLSTPPVISAETGMNALAHCIEAAYSPTRSAEAEALALAGMRQIVLALPRVFEHPDDLDARTDMLAAASLAGRALQNASMGLHHGLCQLLGGRTGIPHGRVNAILLPFVMKFNTDAVPEAMDAIGWALNAPTDAEGVVATLVHRLDLSAALSDFGVAEEDIDAVARQAGSNANVAANPKPVTEEDVATLLYTVL